MIAVSVPVAPIAPQERVPAMDILRGFALLGIFVMNILYFGMSFYAGADGTRVWPEPHNVVAEVLRDMLFAGKFNSMLSFLFGIGFAMQLERLEARDPARAVPIFLRRMVFLLLLGVLHAVFFFTADVLHIYAVIGFAMLLLRNATDRTLMVLFFAMLALGPLWYGVRVLTVTPDMTAARIAEMQALAASNGIAYGQGSFFDAAREHAKEMVYHYTSPHTRMGAVGAIVLFAMTMVLGFIVGRRNWMRHLYSLQPLVKRVQWISLWIGLASAAVFVSIFALHRKPGPDFLKMAGITGFLICRIALMLFYVCTFVRIAMVPSWRARLAPLAAAGRMPLTIYLSQSVISAAIFYGWGLGLWGKVGPAGAILMAIALFFLVQVPFSVWWLRRFDYGPLEWLWRLVAYGRKPAARRAVRLDATGQAS